MGKQRPGGRGQNRRGPPTRLPVTKSPGSDFFLIPGGSHPPKNVAFDVTPEQYPGTREDARQETPVAKTSLAGRNKPVQDASAPFRGRSPWGTFARATPRPARNKDAGLPPWPLRHKARAPSSPEKTLRDLRGNTLGQALGLTIFSTKVSRKTLEALARKKLALRFAGLRTLAACYPRQESLSELPLSLVVPLWAELPGSPAEKPPGRVFASAGHRRIGQNPKRPGTATPKALLNIRSVG